MNHAFAQIVGYATDFSMFFASIFKNQAKQPTIGYEWLVVLFFIFVVFVVSITLGRSKMVVALLSIYAAAFIQDRFVFFDYLERMFKNKPTFLIDIGLFIVIYLLVFLAMTKILNNSRILAKESSFFMILPIALLEVGLLASLLFPYLPEHSGIAIIDNFKSYFITKNAQFWWAAAPLITLLFIKFKKNKRSSS